MIDVYFARVGYGGAGDYHEEFLNQDDDDLVYVPYYNDRLVVDARIVDRPVFEGRIVDRNALSDRHRQTTSRTWYLDLLEETFFQLLVYSYEVVVDRSDWLSPVFLSS